MPRKNSKAIEIKQTAVVLANEWLITSIVAVSLYGTNKDNLDGNIVIGDILSKRKNGSYRKVEKFVVHYVALLENEVVEINHIEVTGNYLKTLVERNKKARNIIKNSGYDALELMNIVPASSTIE